MKILPNNIAVIENDTHISKWVEEHGTLAHNKGLARECQYYIRTDDVVVEVGAFIGDNTEFIRQRAKKVYSFEPNPTAYECLKYNAQKWDNVQIHNVGIGAESSSMSIVGSDNVGASFGTEGGNIPVITIDSLGLEQVDFILIDCEGYELDVLVGATNTISKHKPTMVIEINEGTLARRGITAKDIFNFLQTFGYFYRNIYNNEPMSGPQYDILCFKS